MKKSLTCSFQIIQLTIVNSRPQSVEARVSELRTKNRPIFIIIRYMYIQCAAHAGCRNLLFERRRRNSTNFCPNPSNNSGRSEGRTKKYQKLIGPKLPSLPQNPVSVPACNISSERESLRISKKARLEDG